MERKAEKIHKDKKKSKTNGLMDKMTSCLITRPYAEKKINPPKKSFNLSSNIRLLRSGSVSSHLDAGSLRNGDFPGTVQIVGVRLWVSRREDSASALSQHAATGN